MDVSLLFNKNSFKKLFNQGINTFTRNIYIFLTIYLTLILLPNIITIFINRNMFLIEKMRSLPLAIIYIFFSLISTIAPILASICVIIFTRRRLNKLDSSFSNTLKEAFSSIWKAITTSLSILLKLIPYMLAAFILVILIALILPERSVYSSYKLYRVLVALIVLLVLLIPLRRYFLAYYLALVTPVKNLRAVNISSEIYNANRKIVNLLFDTSVSLPTILVVLLLSWISLYSYASLLFLVPLGIFNQVLMISITIYTVERGIEYRLGQYPN